MRPTIEIVDRAEETEQQVIARAVSAREAEGQAWYTIGECADAWCERYAAGRTDSDFAKLIGSDRQRVNEAKRVWQRFGSIVRTTGQTLSYSHFVTALSWEDAETYLELAGECGLSVDNMEKRRRIDLRIDSGDDLTAIAELQQELGMYTTDTEVGGQTDVARIDGGEDMEESGGTDPAPPVDRDPSEGKQPGHRVPAEVNHDVDRTRMARDPASDDDRKQRLKLAKKLFSAAFDLAALDAACCQRVVDRLREDVKVNGSGIEVPDVHTLKALVEGV